MREEKKNLYFSFSNSLFKRIMALSIATVPLKMGCLAAGNLSFVRLPKQQSWAKWASCTFPNGIPYAVQCCGGGGVGGSHIVRTIKFLYSLNAKNATRWPRLTKIHASMETKWNIWVCKINLFAPCHRRPNFDSNVSKPRDCRVVLCSIHCRRCDLPVFGSLGYAYIYSQCAIIRYCRGFQLISDFCSLKRENPENIGTFHKNRRG